jgi:predicted CoA-binding protein|nr:MAG TPA: hypothetical protein [Caudoviricetes sp.]
MNEIIKKFVEIADKNNYNIISINPIQDDDELFEEITTKLKELLNFDEEVDLFYLVEIEGGIIFAFPVVRALIREDLMLKLEDIFL